MPAEPPVNAVLFQVDCNRTAFSFYRPRDPTAILDAVTDREFSQDEQLPYWAEHWPSATVMLPWLRATLAAGNHRIAEIGAGLGIISAVLARTHPRTVATDIFAESCRYCRANMEQTVSHPMVARADWRHPPFKPCLDLIVGSDVLYEERWIQPVLRCALSCLAPGGIAFIADPRRRWWDRFQTEAVELGMQCTIVHSAITNEGKTTVDIAQLSRD